MKSFLKIYESSRSFQPLYFFLVLVLSFNVCEKVEAVTKFELANGFTLLYERGDILVGRTKTDSTNINVQGAILQKDRQDIASFEFLKLSAIGTLHSITHIHELSFSGMSLLDGEDKLAVGQFELKNWPVGGLTENLFVHASINSNEESKAYFFLSDLVILKGGKTRILAVEEIQFTGHLSPVFFETLAQNEETRLQILGLRLSNQFFTELSHSNLELILNINGLSELTKLGKNLMSSGKFNVEIVGLAELQFEISTEITKNDYEWLFLTGRSSNEALDDLAVERRLSIIAGAFRSLRVKIIDKGFLGFYAKIAESEGLPQLLSLIELANVLGETKAPRYTPLLAKHASKFVLEGGELGIGMNVTVPLQIRDFGLIADDLDKFFDRTMLDVVHIN